MSSRGELPRSRSPSPVPPSATHSSRSAREESKEAFQIILEMSELLQTQLTETELGYCVTLLEDGADPLKLAQLIKDWKEKGRREGRLGQPRVRTAPESSSRLASSSAGGGPLSPRTP